MGFLSGILSRVAKENVGFVSISIFSNLIRCLAKYRASYAKTDLPWVNLALEKAKLVM